MIAIIKQAIASNKTAIVSVDNPLSYVISSERTLLRTPGALSLLSNQAICLWMIYWNSS